MRDQTRNIVCHAHHVSFEKKNNNDSFLVLRTSGRLSKRVVLIFITRLSTCFTRVDFSSARVGIFTRLTSSVARVSLAAAGTKRRSQVPGHRSQVTGRR